MRANERARTARDVREELEFHHEMRARDAAAPPAHRTASERTLVKLARSRDRRLRLAGAGRELWADAADVLRRLRRAPGFTAGAIGILAIGLGASSAVFGLVNAAYLRPLPFAHADRLVRVQEYSRRPDGAVGWVDASAPTLDEVRTNGLFDGSAALRPTSISLTTDDGPARFVGAGAVTRGWSDVLGVAPAQGRLFTPEEERLGSGAGVAVISDHFWRTWFNGRPDVLGQVIRSDDAPRTVVGVLPPGFRFPYEQDIWWPGTIAPDERGFFIFGRLAPGVSVDAANARFDAVGASLRQAWPQTMHGLTPRAKPLRDFVMEEDGRVVGVLAAAAALLMLIVSSNAAMLMTTRVVARDRELSLRAALGCGRGRLMRHIVLETVMLFLAGGVAGVAVSQVLPRVLDVTLPLHDAAQVPIGAVTFDWRMLTFSVALALATGALCGLVAARRARRAVASSSARAIGSASGRRMLSGLVAVELMLAAALVAACAIVGDALTRIEHRDVGFPTHHLVTAQFELSGPRFASPSAHIATLTRLEDRFRALPGVASVGSGTVNPICCGDWGSRATPEGVYTKLEDAALVNWRIVSPGFFKTLGIRVLSGRVFDDHDAASSEPVVVVDSRFARRMWPGRDAVGQRVKRGGTDSPTAWMRVIGVVSPVEDAGDYTDTWYVPYLQAASLPSSDQLHVWVRVHDTADTATSMGALRRAIAEVDPSLGIIQLRTMDEIKRTELNERRDGSRVAMIFAATGALLALAGIYGLVSFVVAGESKEMAVRLALGAAPRLVMARVVLRIVRLSVAGVAVGLAGVWLATPYVVALVGAPSGGVGLLGLALVVGLVACAAAAAAMPARRILRLDPRQVLQG